MDKNEYQAWEITSPATTFEEAFGKLQQCTKPRRPLQPTEVRVRVESIALNYFDILQLVGRYQVKLTPPFVPVRRSTQSQTLLFFVYFKQPPVLLLYLESRLRFEVDDEIFCEDFGYI